MNLAMNKRALFDKCPQKIADLEERLCHSFQWGLIADIQK
jgi:chromosomal replication initiation ATPase DnaA